MSQPMKKRSNQQIVRWLFALATMATLAVLVAPGAALADTGKVSGTVVGPHDRPVSGYRVQIVDGGIVRASSELTGRRGRFQLSGAASSSYEIQVTDEHGKVCGSRRPAFELQDGTELHLTIRLDSHPCTGAGISLANQATREAARLGAKSWWLAGLGGAAAVALLANSDDTEAPVSPSEP